MRHGAKTAQAWAKLQIFQLHAQFCEFTEEISFYMEPEFKIEAELTSLAPVHFFGKLACMFYSSVPDGLRSKAGFMKVQVYLTIDFYNQVGSKGLIVV